MTFLNPLLLLGLAAAAIPILVHLFNFRRPRKVVFSSLAFLKELQKSTMQRVRVQQWLLLALRIGALAALALAFARPVVEGFAGDALGRANTSVVLVVDNSRSMLFRDAQGAYFDQARALAANLAGRLEKGDEVFLLPTAADPARRPAPFRTQAALLDALAALEVSNTTRPLTASIDRAAALLEASAYPAREIYVVSDFQASTLADSGRTPIPFEGRVVLLPVGGSAQRNVAVTDVRVTSRIIESGQPVTLVATLVNYGPETLDSYGATVMLEDRAVAQNTTTLPPGVPTPLQFTFTPDARGWLGGVVSIEADAFEEDNARAFALYVPEQRRVLIVRGENVNTRYVELALSPALAQGRGAFEVSTIPEERFSGTDLSAYDALVLAGPSTLASGEVQALVQFIAGGGGVLAFPSERVEALNALLAALQGGTLATPTGESGGSTATFGAIDREHPVFDGVFDDARGQVEQPDIYRYAPYRAGSGAQTTLISLADKGAFLQEIRQERGGLFLFTSALDGRWSDLPTRGLFVPLLYRSLFYLAAPEGVEEGAQVAGNPLRLQLGGRREGTTLRLTSPSGQTYVPEQRALFGSTLVETGEPLTETGLYTLTADGAVVRRLPVNPDARESEPAVLTGRAAREKITTVTGLEPTLVAPEDALEERVQAALRAPSGGREIWNILLWVALFFLVAEMIVAWRWRPTSVPA